MASSVDLLERYANWRGSKVTGRGGLAIGRTGRFPGGLAANLARCPAFIYFLYHLLFLFYIVVVVFVAYRMY